MARNFVRASSHKLEVASPAVTAYPFAMACWFRTTDAANTQHLMSISDTGGNVNYWNLSAAGAVVGDPVRVVANDGGGDTFAATTTGYTTNTWHHAAGIFVSATDRRVLLDAANKGTIATSRTPTGLDVTTIGAVRVVAGNFSHMSGDIAEAAIWDLSVWTGANDTERADNFEKCIGGLYRGRLPIDLPLGLVAYWPIGGIQSPEIDLHPRSQGATDRPMTVTGATNANHSPVVPYSSRFWGGQTDEVGGGGGSSVPVFMHHYKTRLAG